MNEKGIKKEGTQNKNYNMFQLDESEEEYSDFEDEKEQNLVVETNVTKNLHLHMNKAKKQDIDFDVQDYSLDEDAEYGKVECQFCKRNVNLGEIDLHESKCMMHKQQSFNYYDSESH